MKVLCVLAVLVAVANAAMGPDAVLAPSAGLKSFIESGSHTDAEIDAMARAQLDALFGSSSDSEASAESDVEAAVEAEADAEMPRDTKAETLAAKRRARLAAMKKAHRAPVPPPKGVVGAAAAMPEGDDRNDLIKLVYDELKRLGTVGSVQLPTPGQASVLGVTDPRVATLEHRLGQFEKKRTEEANKAQDSAIAAITSRLEGLDKTLATLKKSAEAQAALSAQLLRVQKTAAKKEAAGTPVPSAPSASGADYSVDYVKATLPADFEKQVAAILKSVKKESRKIYERYCKLAIKKAKAAAKNKATAAAAKAAGAPAADGMPKVMTSETPSTAPVSAADAVAALKEAQAEEAPKHGRKHRGAGAAAAKKKEDSAKIMQKPIIVGKEPTAGGMRLAKALNDVAIALPVTPAYQLGREQSALQDVLGESAVNPKWKTARL